MSPRRETVGLLVSLLLHGGLLFWVVVHAPAPEPPDAVPVELELLVPATEVAPQAEQRPRPEPPQGDARAAQEPEPQLTAPRSLPRSRAVPRRRQVPVTPEDAEVEVEPEATPVGDDANAGPSTPTVAGDGASPARARGTSDRRGSAGSEGRGAGRGSGVTGGGQGFEGTPDHTAYGAELVRIVKAEIDADPVPGLGSEDSIEVLLEVLPSGRLARWGLGKYDYAQVVHSTLGPLRMKAILRRVLRASEAFPPHPSSFPRQRFVVGITVRFRDQRG